MVVVRLKGRNLVYYENLMLSWRSLWTAFYRPYSIASADRYDHPDESRLAVGADRYSLPLHPCLDDAVFAQKVELAGLEDVDLGTFDPVGSHARLHSGLGCTER